MFLQLPSVKKKNSSNLALHKTYWHLTLSYWLNESYLSNFSANFLDSLPTQWQFKIIKTPMRRVNPTVFPHNAAAWCLKSFTLASILKKTIQPYIINTGREKVPASNIQKSTSPLPFQMNLEACSLDLPIFWASGPKANGALFLARLWQVPHVEKKGGAVLSLNTMKHRFSLAELAGTGIGDKLRNLCLYRFAPGTDSPR